MRSNPGLYLGLLFARGISSTSPARITSVENIALLVNTIATAATAIVSVTLWRLLRLQHALANTAKLKVAIAKAQFYSATKEIRVEVLLANQCGADAVVQSWDLYVLCEGLQVPLSDGTCRPTTLMKVQVYIGSVGWVIGRSTPAALSLTKKLAYQLSGKAVVRGTISYVGGSEEVSTLEIKDIPVSVI